MSILKLEKHPKNWEFQLRHLEDGKKQEKLKLLEQPENTDYSTSKHIKTNKKLNKSIVQKTLKKNQKDQKSFIVECPLQNKKKTSKGKLNISLKNIKDIKYIEKSVQESTLKEKSCIPSWTKHLKERSQKLWLPTKIDSADLRGIISSGYLTNSESISWSTVIQKKQQHQMNNLQTTSCLSSMSSQADITVYDQKTELQNLQKTRLKTIQTQENKVAARLKKEKIIKELGNNGYIPKCKNVKIKPTKQQKRILDDWFASYRKTWNLALHSINKENTEISDNILRNKFVIKKNMEVNKNIEWIFRTPKRIREYAIKDIVYSYKSCFTRLKKKQIQHFTINPKSKNSSLETICISHEHSHIINSGKCIRMHCMDIVLEEKLEDFTILNNMRLSKENEEYILHIPYFMNDKNIPKRHYTDVEDVISLDPGIRTFLSYYSPRGEIGTIGEDFDSYLQKQYKKIKKYNENYSQNISKKKYEKKILRKIKNKRDDLHWKTCHWLLKNYKTIIIPRLYIQKSTPKDLKNKMRDMKHCLLVDRLKIKMLEYSNRKVVEVKEQHTSKTCTCCGWQNNNLNDNKLFKCEECSLILDRDINASRNILLKNFLH